MANTSRRELLALGTAGFAYALLAPARADAADAADDLVAVSWVGEEGRLASAASVAADATLARSGVRLAIDGRVPDGAALQFLDVRVVLPSDPPVEFHAWSHDARDTPNVRTSGPVGLFVPLASDRTLRLTGVAQYSLPGRASQVVGEGGRPALVKRPWSLEISLSGGRGPKLRSGTYLIGFPERATAGAPSWSGFRFTERPREEGGVSRMATRALAGGAVDVPRFPYIVLTAERAAAAEA